MTTIVSIDIINAFMDAGEGGNPAGVVVAGGADLSPAQRQAVAAAVGLSETAFVLPSDSADVKLEFYTPTQPIPHCGHATVASFSRLAQLGRLSGDVVVNETVDGPRRIRLVEGKAFLEQLPARFEQLSDELAAQTLAGLGITANDLLPETVPLRADNGNGTLLVALRDTAKLAALTPDMPAIAAVTDALKAVCIYAFSLQATQPGRAATARMFGPGYGIPEEAATGMAAGPLGCWLADRRPEDWVFVEQGVFMTPPSPSLIEINLDRQADGSLARVWVGGLAAVIGRKTVTV